MSEEQQKPERKNESKAPPASCVKFDEEQYQQIRKDSETTGKSIPSLLKTAYFAGRRAIVFMDKESQSAWHRELRHWGNNLNQIAKRVNSGLEAGWQDDLEPIRQAIRRIENMVLGVYGSR